MTKALDILLEGEPVAITEAGLQLVLAVVSRDRFFGDIREQALAAKAGEPLLNSHATEVRNGVAVIPVAGPLMRHSGVLEKVSGATSYDTIRKDFELALDDPDVRSILLNIDSPGGEVDGVGELSDAIYAARGRKPITAYVGHLAASAAYWIASAADEIVAAESASLGSIGVLASVKRAGADDKEMVDIISSQSPHKRLDVDAPDDRAKLQRRIDDLASVFIERVARNRGVGAVAVKEHFGQGDLMIAARAVANQVADRISNFEAVLGDLAYSRGVTTMQYPKLAAVCGLAENASGDDIVSKVTKLVNSEKTILAATGATDIDGAIGAIVAGKQALGEVDALRAEHAKLAAASNARDFRAMLETALAENRVTMGALMSAVPSMMDDGDKIAAALDAMPEQTSATLLDAMCSARISAADVKRVSGYCARQKSSVIPTPVKDPPHDPTKALRTAEDLELDAMFAAARGQR